MEVYMVEKCRDCNLISTDKPKFCLQKTGNKTQRLEE